MWIRVQGRFLEIVSSEGERLRSRLRNCIVPRNSLILLPANVSLPGGMHLRMSSSSCIPDTDSVCSRMSFWSRDCVVCGQRKRLVITGSSRTFAGCRRCAVLLIKGCRQAALAWKFCLIRDQMMTIKDFYCHQQSYTKIVQLIKQVISRPKLVGNGGTVAVEAIQRKQKADLTSVYPIHETADQEMRGQREQISFLYPPTAPHLSIPVSALAESAKNCSSFLDAHWRL